MRASGATPLSRLRAVDPGLFRPRLARRPALVALVATALVVPAVLLPNPQDLVIAQNRQVREEAERQAERIDEIAKDLEGKGADANDPRTQLAEELRELAERLRTNPGDLDLNLAQLGAVEDDVRAQLDPANEQRAASLAALSGRSRGPRPATEGEPRRRSEGDARRTSTALGDKVDEMTQAERDAREGARGAPGRGEPGRRGRGPGAPDAASSLAQGDTRARRRP